MSIITTERLTKILSETQAVITQCNSRGVHGSVEVNARLFENVLMELLRHRATMLKGAEPVSNCDELTDGWVACSERMPEGMTDVHISNGHDVGQGWWDGDTWQTQHDYYSVPGDVTHWMPMPAAPQQEADNG